ncbi:MAG: DUF952 domain-containing protein [Parachlamydia sp.]|nr:DUF952 domain-containing protein [Parachlamydia sp.]
MIKALLTLLLLLPVTLLAEADSVPKYLYKIVSMDNWCESQARPVLKLSNLDDQFIHLAAEKDIGRILEKYWEGYQEVVILKLVTDKLKGRMEYEANPGGTNKYYHLYNGTIPREAVVESKILHRDESGAFLSY